MRILDQEAEGSGRGLEAATRLSDVNAAAKRLVLAKTELKLKRLEPGAGGSLAVVHARRTFPEHPVL
jgi:hypothetical protein